jgi:hypothetical protein
MGAQLKPAGRAVAIAKGHYPGVDGRHRVISAGETFTVFEGLAKARWFTVLKAEERAPAPVVPEPAPPEPNTLSGAAVAERRRRAAVKAPTADPSADDIVGDDIA